MSVILDALRKSENERQQSAVPSIGDAPAVVHNTGVPKWIVAIIAALAAGVLILGWAWWQSGSSDEAAVAIVRPTGVLPRTDSLVPTTTSGAVRSLAREPTVGSAESSQTSQQAPIEPVVQAAPAAEVPIMVIGPPTIMELLAAGVVLPELTLELHVYSASPAERFIRINSASYREGEVLSEGPRVISITAEGVILDYRGQNFLLSAD